jgi:hypothetical protein
VSATTGAGRPVRRSRERATRRSWHHRGMPDDLDAALDRLYGLPAEEFTAARDALAKELRGAKRRDEADAVKQRRRPTVPAAAINQLARREPELVEALIRAAGDLVGVQERVLEGDAGRDELRAAADAERRAVGALMAAAAQLPDNPSAAALEKVRDTLQAAATDDAVREAIAGGRLEREAEPAGAWGGAFPLGGGIGAPPTAEPSTPGGATPKRSTAKQAGSKKAASAGTTPRGGTAEGAAAERAAVEEEDEEAEELVSASDRAAERRARKRAEALERARAEDADAQHELTEAQAAAGEAHELLEAAAQRAEAARAAVVDAEAAEDEARSEAQRTLRALKRAEAVAADTAEKVARLDRG